MQKAPERLGTKPRRLGKHHVWLAAAAAYTVMSCN